MTSLVGTAFNFTLSVLGKVNTVTFENKAFSRFVKRETNPNYFTLANSTGYRVNGIVTKEKKEKRIPLFLKKEEIQASFVSGFNSISKIESVTIYRLVNVEGKSWHPLKKDDKIKMKSSLCLVKISTVWKLHYLNDTAKDFNGLSQVEKGLKNTNIRQDFKEITSNDFKALPVSGTVGKLVFLLLAYGMVYRCRRSLSYVTKKLSLSTFGGFVMLTLALVRYDRKLERIEELNRRILKESEKLGFSAIGLLEIGNAEGWKSLEVQNFN